VKRSVTSWDKHGNVDNRRWDGGGDLPSKAEGAGNPSRFGRTRGSAGPTWPPFSAAFGCVTARWALLSITSVPGLCSLVFSDLWALLCKCDAGLDILCICVASFICFCLIPCMGACNPRITKTCGNG